MRPNQQQGFTLIQRKRRQRIAEVLQVEMAFLLRMGFEPSGLDAVHVLHLTSALAILGMELVAQNGCEPRLEVRAALEPISIGPGAQNVVLDQIIGTIRVVRQGTANARRVGIVASISSRRASSTMRGGSFHACCDLLNKAYEVKPFIIPIDE